MPLTMIATYPNWDYNGSHVVAQTATTLFQSRPRPCRLSPLIFMSDPSVIPNVIKTVQRLPKHTAIIYRHFRRPNRLEEATKLRQITFERRQQLIIGADPELAINVGADGVHFKRDKTLTLPRLWRKRCPHWIISMAGIKSGDYSEDISVLDGLLLSSVFSSSSPSSGAAIGIDNFSDRIKDLNCPIFALGGVTEKTAPSLINSGAYGLAGIRGLTSITD